MFTVSVGKRIEGDRIPTHEQRRLVFAGLGDAKYKTTNVAIVCVKNLRKVYSIAVTLVSWTQQNLSTTYNTTYNGADCSGLAFELEPRASLLRQCVVVGAVHIPAMLLKPYKLVDPISSSQIRKRRYTPLMSKHVRLSSHSRLTGNAQVDLVLPHRIAKEPPGWPFDSDTNKTVCSGRVEPIVQFVESNHMYMERTLQPPITAAVFFLFQNAVVHDVAKTNDRKIIVLDFAGNVQRINVNMSAPSRERSRAVCRGFDD